MFENNFKNIGVMTELQDNLRLSPHCVVPMTVR